MQKKMATHLPRVPLPPNSPDLNIIENLWAYTQEKLSDRRFTTTSGLYKCLKDVWAAVPNTVLRNLVADMPRRLRLIRRAKGDNIRLH